MKLFKIENWEVKVEEEVWTLEPFKALLKRDKTKEKETAFKEMAFIYHYADIRSDYTDITDPEDREQEVKKDVGLPDKWKIDDTMEEAIEFYENRSGTIAEKLYRSALKSASDTAEYLNNTKALLDERDDKGKPVFTLSTITASQKNIPDIMKNLKTAYKELLKEKEEKEGRKKGAREFGMFEDGLQ